MAHPAGISRSGFTKPVERPPGRQQVVDLDAADLNQPVAGLGVEAGGFGVEDDFASHDPILMASVSAAG